MPKQASRRELCICALPLGLIALAMSATHVARGGFYFDDWAVLALGRFPPHGGLLHALWLDYGQRPGQVLYYAALDALTGTDAAARLALAAAAAALSATCLWTLLRRMGMRAPEALCVAGLALTFPFSDSLWLWGILSLTSIALAASLLGIVLALRAFERSGRRALALHAASLSLYVISILSYELFAVAGCLAGLLYARVLGLRRARGRWALDALVILAALLVARVLLPVAVATPSRTLPLGSALAHAGHILLDGARVAGAAILPFRGIDPLLGDALLLAGLGVSPVAARRLAAASERAELRRPLAIAACGVLVALAAWAVYIPAPEHYSPAAVGTVNRVNAGASIGLALLVYGFVVLLARTLARALRLPAGAAGALTVVASLALAGAYVVRSAADARAWDAAAAAQRRVLAELHAALPHLPEGARVYAFDAPLLVGPGIPVLNTALDLTSAMRISYASRSLVAVPLAAAKALVCAARGPVGGGVVGSYRASFLVDVGARRALALRGRSQCAGAAALRFAARRALAGQPRRPAVA